MRVIAILGALVVTGCGAAAERAEPTPSILRVVSASELVGTVSTVAARPVPARSGGSLLPTVPPPAAPSPSPSQILPGGEIPLDLRDSPPPAIQSEPADGVASVLGGRDVAVTWVMERYTARFDEPATERSGRLAALTSDHELVSSEPPASAQVVGGATWPINVTVSEGAAGEWHVTFTLNRTPAGGPLVTMTTTVTVTGDLVTREQVQP